MSFDNWAGQRAAIEKLEPRAYLAAGGLDPSFGRGGKVLTDFSAPADSEASAVVVLPDGKVLAAGQAVTDMAHSSFAMTRFLSDGRVDATFGDGGQVVLSFGGNAVASDVVRLGDGRILAAGTVDGRILVARFSSEGVLDKTFGQGGTVLSAARTDFIYERSCVRVQSDGKIIVAAAGGDSTTTSPAIHLMRLNTSGAIDASFGNAGSLDVDFGYFDYFAGIELRGDDRIVLGGSYVDQSQHSGIVLMQFLKDGRVDKSFAGTGQVRGHLFNSQEEIKDIAIDQKGRILLLDAENRQWGVGRFRADGVLDRSFATRGVRYVEIDTGDSKANVETGQLAVQADGKILTIGDAFVNFDPTDDMIIARLTDGGRRMRALARVELHGLC